jgi:hypothetical protein
MKSPVVTFVVIFAAVFLLHLPLLRLPYFWDEAGYYIPAARDLLLTGSVIPHSTPSNAHPPLVMAYLALSWKIAGFSPGVTRSAMLLVSAFALFGVFRLARRVANTDVAVATMICTAFYPVFFAQSSMAHVDLAAAGLTIWGLDAYLGERWRAPACWFALAVLAKETAVLAPVALLAWEVLAPRFGLQPLKAPSFANETASLKRGPDTNRIDSPEAHPASLPNSKRVPRPSSAWAGIFPRNVSLLAPVLVLCLWYAYHSARTGYVFGNPEFFRYNVQSTLNPLRIVLAFFLRLWQAFGYMHLFVLTILMGFAMMKPPLRDNGVDRARIDLPVQAIFAVLVLTYVAAMAVVGGAVLARYMLPVVPLVILVAVATLWRRLPRWQLWIAFVAAAFVAALVLNPPDGFSPEDNLAYRDYVIMHEGAAAYLEDHYAQARVLTAWPASDEISRPYLGYVRRPLSVVRIENFTAEQVMGAAQERSRFDVALVFSTKYEPAHPVMPRWPVWEKLKERFFGYHHDLPPVIAAQLLGGHVVYEDHRPGQWVAVIEMERVYEARRGTRTSKRSPIDTTRNLDN